MNKKVRCPVCGYDDIGREVTDFALCPCCYTQFGYSEIGRSYDGLRQKWIKSGALWREGEETQPLDYDPIIQLRNINYEVSEAERAAIVAAQLDALATEATMQSLPSKTWARTSGSSASAVDWPRPIINIFTKSPVFS